MRELDPSLEFHALGGDALRAAGAIVHHDTVANAAMGLAAFKRAGEVKRLLSWTRAFYAKEKPDLHICCDSWTMNVHFARLAKSFDTKVFYYISPQVWASREGRVAKLKLVADRVASILPFETKFLRDRGVNATFVGHPLFDELAKCESPIETDIPNSPPLAGGVGGGGERRKDSPLRSAAPHAPPPNLPREGGGVDTRHSERATQHERSTLPFPVIALPCGSRRGVVKNNLPRQLEVARRIKAKFPSATFLIPSTPVTHAIVEQMIAGLDYVSAEVNGFDRQIPRCDLAITVSGTATLHIAAHRVPMIIVYYVNRAAWHLIARWLVTIRTYGIVNLLANDGDDDPAKHIVPEFMPWFGPVDAVADAAIDLLEHPAKLAEQKSKIDTMLATINQPGASKNAAKIAMELLNG